MKKKLILIPASFILIILFFTAFGDRGLLRIYRLTREKAEMTKRVEELTAENDRLRREIEALKTDRRYLENIARKDFGLVKKEEVVYQFSSSARSAGPSPKAK